MRGASSRSPSTERRGRARCRAGDDAHATGSSGPCTRGVRGDRVAASLIQIDTGATAVTRIAIGTLRAVAWQRPQAAG